MGLRGPEPAGAPRTRLRLRAAAALVAGDERGRQGHRRGGPAGRDVRAADEPDRRHRGAVARTSPSVPRARSAWSTWRDRAVEETWRLRSALVDFDGRTGRPTAVVRRRPGTRVGTRSSSPRRCCSRPTGRRCSACRARAASRLPVGGRAARRAGRSGPADRAGDRTPSRGPLNSPGPPSDLKRAGRVAGAPILSRADPVCHAGMWTPVWWRSLRCATRGGLPCFAS